MRVREQHRGFSLLCSNYGWGVVETERVERRLRPTPLLGWVSYLNNLRKEI